MKKNILVACFFLFAGIFSQEVLAAGKSTINIAVRLLLLGSDTPLKAEISLDLKNPINDVFVDSDGSIFIATGELPNDDDGDVCRVSRNAEGELEVEASLRLAGYPYRKFFSEVAILDGRGYAVGERLGMGECGMVAFDPASMSRLFDFGCNQTVESLLADEERKKLYISGEPGGAWNFFGVLAPMEGNDINIELFMSTNNPLLEMTSFPSWQSIFWVMGKEGLVLMDLAFPSSAYPIGAPRFYFFEPGVDRYVFEFQDIRDVVVDEATGIAYCLVAGDDGIRYRLQAIKLPDKNQAWSDWLWLVNAPSVGAITAEGRPVFLKKSANRLFVGLEDGVYSFGIDEDGGLLSGEKIRDGFFSDMELTPDEKGAYLAEGNILWLIGLEP